MRKRERRPTAEDGTMPRLRTSSGYVLTAFDAGGGDDNGNLRGGKHSPTRVPRFPPCGKLLEWHKGCL